MTIKRIMRQTHEEIQTEIDRLVNEITVLTDQWYMLIGSDHHKDRDCHWYIETKWSYGQPPTYTVQHFGYIIHPDINIESETYAEALQTLKRELITHIEIEKIDQANQQHT